MKIILIALVVLLNVIFCQSEYTLIRNSELKSAFVLNSSPTFKGYFYMGSNSQYHYFQSRWDWQKDKKFMIRISDLEVIKPFEFGVKELRINLNDSVKTVFGKNQYHILYIE